MTEQKVCCICKKHFSERGNNPFPIKKKGVCCDDCNHFEVIPARMKLIVSQYNRNPAN